MHRVSEGIIVPICSLALLIACVAPLAAGIIGKSEPAADGAGVEPQHFGLVVVLDAPRLPYYGVVPGASAQRLVQRLQTFGIESESRSAEDIAERGLSGVGVFVTLHGNSYPRMLEPQLLAFREHGGSIVSTGVPFTHPCVRTHKSWRDLGHNSSFMQQLEFGGFTGPVRSKSELTVGAGGRRAGLDQFAWANLGPLSAQVLDCGALPDDVSCEPLLSIPAAGGGSRPVSALLRRGTARVPDAWALTLTLHDEGGVDLEAHCVEIVARVVALVCEARGAIDLSATPLPPVPSALREFATTQGLKPIRSTPRPTAERIYPRADEIATTLLVADARKWSPDERLLARTVQGLANRQTARVWLHQKKVDPFWLAWLQKRGDFKQVTEVPSLKELLERCPPAGVVVYDPQRRHSINIATMIAGVEDLAVASPELAERYHLQIKDDLRGRFATNADAYAWAFEKLWPRMSHQVIACVNPSPRIALHDYLVSQRVFTFWISGWVDGREPGASAADENRVLAGILQRMPANIPVLGYPWAGDGLGIQEGPGVNLFSRTGKFLVPSDHMPNLSVLTATRPVAPWKQPPPRRIQLERDKVYVALTMSDGDNLNVYYDRFLDDWRDAHHGEFAIGWTLGPSAVDFYPAVVDWYAQHLAPRDHVQGAVSGIGYVYPDHYGEAFTDRDRVLSEFCTLTDQYMRRLDQRTLWVMGATDATCARLAAEIPAATAFFADYGHVGGITIDNAIVTTDNKPIFHVLVDGPPRRLGQNLVTAVGARRPAFVHAFLLNWGWRVADVAKLATTLPDDYVLVRPDELGTLFMDWRGQSPDDRRPPR